MFAPITLKFRQYSPFPFSSSLPWSLRTCKGVCLLWISGANRYCRPRSRGVGDSDSIPDVQCRLLRRSLPSVCSRNVPARGVFVCDRMNDENEVRKKDKRKGSTSVGSGVLKLLTPCVRNPADGRCYASDLPANRLAE